MRLTQNLSKATTSQPSNDGVNYFHNDGFPKDNNIDPRFLPNSVSTIHYRFIQIDKHIPETSIPSWFQVRGVFLLNPNKD
jgi:hypothetical protein